MSHVPNARKNEDQTGIKERIIESGLVRSGGKPDVVSSPPTQFVYRAEIKARCHTTPQTMFTEDRNTFTFLTLTDTAEDAIRVSIRVCSCAPNVKKLDQNPKVNAAIDALLRRIRNELYFAGNTGTEQETHGTGNSTEGSSYNERHFDRIDSL